MTEMNDLWTVSEFAQWKHKTRNPSKAKENAVRKMCQDGRLPARKVAGQWRINTRKILEGFDGK